MSSFNLFFPEMSRDRYCQHIYLVTAVNVTLKDHWFVSHFLWLLYELSDRSMSGKLDIKSLKSMEWLKPTHNF